MLLNYILWQQLPFQFLQQSCYRKLTFNESYYLIQVDYEALNKWCYFSEWTLTSKRNIHFLPSYQRALDFPIELLLILLVKSLFFFFLVDIGLFILYYMLTVLSGSSKDLKSLKLSYLQILTYHVFPCSEFIQKFVIFLPLNLSELREISKLGRGWISKMNSDSNIKYQFFQDMIHLLGGESRHHDLQVDLIGS